MGLEFCSLASGSSGNSQYIKSNRCRLLLDAGLSGKYMINALKQIDVDASTLNGILITHEHSDHIKGVGILHRKFGIPIYVHEKTWKVLESKLGKIDASKVNIIKENETFGIQDIVIKALPIAHDAIAPLGYTFSSSSSKIAILTDLGHVPETLYREIYDADLLMLEANHNVDLLMTGRYPYPLKKRVASDVGHLSNEDCGATVIRAIKEGRVGSVLLGHLSRENNTPELAYETVRSMMSLENMVVGEDVLLDLTYRDRMGTLYRIGPKGR
jgi:phosphoribosyl 1,2-cyclic phosphodiesterase